MKMGQQEAATPTHLQRFRATMYAYRGGKPPQTAMSELFGGIMFAKNFEASFLYTTLRGMGREIVKHPVAGMLNMAAYFALLSMAGTIAYCIKQVANGKDVPPLDPTSKEGLMTYVHGMGTGLSLGILDMVMMGDRSPGALFGPVGGLVFGTGAGLVALAERPFSRKRERESVGPPSARLRSGR